MEIDVLSPETVLAGKYRIDSAIGQGGYGQVYLGHDLTMGRPVAIKELLRSEAAASPEDWQDYQLRFHKEAQILSRFSNENVVTAHALETTDDGDMYLVLEYIGGGSLKDALDDGQALPVERALAIATDVCRAVDAIGRGDIVHRDIKPSNILLTEDGRAKLTDFGVAQVGAETRHTQDAVGHPGTPAYKSPEQATTTGYLDQRSDIYALGLVLYEMLTGKLYAHNQVAPGQLNELVPPALSAITMRALQENPAERYQSAQEMLRDLEAVRVQSALGQLRIVLRSLPAPRLVMLGGFALLLAALLGMGRLGAWVGGPAATPTGEQAVATGSATPPLSPTPETPQAAAGAASLPAYELDEQVPMPISVGETQQRVFETEGDVDRVTFRAKAGQTYAVTTGNLALGVDTVLEVQFDGQRLANDDAYAGTMASQVLLTPVQDTTVVVTVYNTDRYGPERTYELSVMLVGEPLIEPPAVQPTQAVVATPDGFPTLDVRLTATPRATLTIRPTWTQAPSITPRPTFTLRATYTPRPTSTPRPTWTRVPTWTPTSTRTSTATATHTATHTVTPTATLTHTPVTPTATNTATPTLTHTPVTPTATDTATPTLTHTPVTPTATEEAPPTVEATPTATEEATPEG